MKQKELIEQIIGGIRSARKEMKTDQALRLKILIGDQGTTNWNGPDVETAAFLLPKKEVEPAVKKFLTSFIKNGVAGQPYRFRFEVHIIDLD